MTRGVLALALLIALAVTGRDVEAAPLDAATCGQLKGEQVLLEQGGVRDSMAKGPAWGKANLDPDKLGQIRRLIELDELLLFRCPGHSLIDLSAEDETDPAATEPEAKAGDKDTAAKPAAKTEAKPKTKEAAKPPPRPKAAPKKKADKDGEAAAPAAKATAAKPKPKPKVDDAYKPPPPKPGADPFANRPPRQ